MDNEHAQEQDEGQADIDREVSATGSLARLLDDDGAEQSEQVGQILELGAWRQREPTETTTHRPGAEGMVPKQMSEIEDETVTAEPAPVEGIESRMDALINPPADPFASFGVDQTRASEIVAGTGLTVPAERVGEFMQALEQAGVHDEASFREFCQLVKQGQVDLERDREREERLAQLEERLGEREQFGPGSALESKLANIEGMLTQQRQVEAAMQAFTAQVEQSSAHHGSALDALAERAQAMGLTPPSPEQIGQIYSSLGLWNADPTVAAAAAFRLAGVDLDARGPTAPYSKRNPSGYVVRPGAVIPTAGTASRERTIDDLAAEAPNG